MKPSVPPPDRRAALAAWYLCNDQRFFWNLPLAVGLLLCFHLFLMRTLSEDAEANLNVSEGEWRALAPKSVADADNAAIEYGRVQAGFVDPPDEARSDLYSGMSAPPAQVGWVAVRAHLAANAQVLKDLLAGAQKAGCSWRGGDEADPDRASPEWHVQYQWAQLLALNARELAHEGDHAGAARALKAIAMLARHVNEASAWQCILEAYGGLDTQVEALEAIVLWDTPRTKEEIAAYREALWLENRFQEWLQRALEYERARTLLALDRMAVTGKPDRGYWISPMFRALDYGPARRSVSEGMAEVLEQVHRGELLSPRMPPRAKCEHLYGKATYAEHVYYTARGSQMLLLRMADQGRVADAALACLQFRLARGRDPTSFDEVTPTFLSAVPRDVYHEHPLRFRHVSAGMAVGTSQVLKGLLLVYSFGANGTDDLGNCTDNAYRRPGLPDDHSFRVPPPHRASNGGTSGQEVLP
jgi:hypothetical protein